MAIAYQTFGRLAPGTTLTALLTVPSSTEYIVYLDIANTGSTDRTFRVKVSPGGAADSITHALAYVTPIRANDAIQWPHPIYLAATDELRVRASHTDVVFNAHGIKIT